MAEPARDEEPAGLAEMAALDRAVVATWNFAEPAASARAFAAAAGRAGSPAQRLILRTQQARALVLAGDPAAAGDLLASVAAELDEIPGAYRPWVAAYLSLERGRVLNTGGDPAASIPEFAAAYDLATAAGAAGLAIDALHMTAIAVGATESPEAAAEWNLRAIAEADSSTDPRARRWLGSLLNNLGWDRHAAGRYAEALEAFQRALLIRIDSGDKSAADIARWSVARVLRSLGRYEEALEIEQALHADPEMTDDPFVSEEIAELRLALDQRD